MDVLTAEEGVIHHRFVGLGSAADVFHTGAGQAGLVLTAVKISNWRAATARAPSDSGAVAGTGERRISCKRATAPWTAAAVTPGPSMSTRDAAS